MFGSMAGAEAVGIHEYRPDRVNRIQQRSSRRINKRCIEGTEKGEDAESLGRFA